MRTPTDDSGRGLSRHLKALALAVLVVVPLGLVVGMMFLPTVEEGPERRSRLEPVQPAEAPRPVGRIALAPAPKERSPIPRAAEVDEPAVVETQQAAEQPPLTVDPQDEEAGDDDLSPQRAENGERLLEVDLEAPIAPTGTLQIRGRVTDPGGNPIERALVWAAPLNGGAPARVPQVETGEDGSFELSGLAAGPYEVAAHAAGFLNGTPVEVEAGAAPAELVLEAGVKLSGRVVQRVGTPVGEGLLVRAVDAEGVPRQIELADGEGVFQLEEMVPGRYHLTAAGPGFTTVEPLTVEVSAGRDVAGIEVVVDPSASLDVTVVARDSGAPVVGATVKVLSEAEMLDGDGLTADFDQDARTGATGRVEVEVQGTGGLFVVAEHRDYATGRHLVRVDPGKSLGPVRIELHPGASLALRLEDVKRAPLGGRMIRLVPDESDRLPKGWTRTNMTDETGAVEFRGLEAGAYGVEVEATGEDESRWVSLADYALAEGESLHPQVPLTTTR